jgi:hypothetical protein
MDMRSLFWGGCAAMLALAAGVWYTADHTAQYPDSLPAHCARCVCRLGMDCSPLGLSWHIIEMTREVMYDTETLSESPADPAPESKPAEPMEVIDLSQIDVQHEAPAWGDEGAEVCVAPDLHEDGAEVVVVPPVAIEECEPGQKPPVVEDGDLPDTMPPCDDEDEPKKAPEHKVDTEELLQFIRFIQESEKGTAHEGEEPKGDEQPAEEHFGDPKPADKEDEPRVIINAEEEKVIETGVQVVPPAGTEPMPEGKPSDCQMDPDYHRECPECPYTGRSSHCPAPCVPEEPKGKPVMHESKKVCIPDICGEETAPGNMPEQVDEETPRHPDVDTMEFRKEDAKKGEFKKKPM